MTPDPVPPERPATHHAGRDRRTPRDQQGWRHLPLPQAQGGRHHPPRRLNEVRPLGGRRPVNDSFGSPPGRSADRPRREKQHAVELVARIPPRCRLRLVGRQPRGHVVRRLAGRATHRAGDLPSAPPDPLPAEGSEDPMKSPCSGRVTRGSIPPDRRSGRRISAPRRTRWIASMVRAGRMLCEARGNAWTPGSDIVAAGVVSSHLAHGGVVGQPRRRTSRRYPAAPAHSCQKSSYGVRWRSSG